MIEPTPKEDRISLLFDLFVLVFRPCERRGRIVCEDATNTALAEEEDTNGVIVRDPESERDRDLCGEERDPVIVDGFIHHRRFVDPELLEERWLDDYLDSRIVSVRWLDWFYWQKPPVFPPQPHVTDVLLAPISHDLYTLTHIGANVVGILIIGGYAEPRIG
ncbi:MAG: hypothetical protein ABEJ59_02355 [Halanaeroarchaeum sp.]